MGIGTWGTSSTADGRKVGALLLPSSDQAVLARVVDVVTRVRTLNLPGVLRVADLVSHQGRAWLVTISPATPTVASLAGRLTPAIAATIAADTGQTLRQLHAANIVHGAVDGSTVVISGSGAALLNEVGIAAAIAGRTADAKDDVAAWANFVKGLVPNDPTLVAVAAAAAAGLETALRVLAANGGSVPGFGDRTALTTLISGAPVVPAQPKVAEAPPEESTTLLPAPVTTPAVPLQPLAPIPQVPTPPVNDAATRMGSRPPASQPAPELRFGRGVPSQPPGTPVWTPPPPAKPKRGAWKTVSAIISGLLTLAVIVVVGIVLWDRFAPKDWYHFASKDPVVITAVEVPDATAKSCAGVVDVIAIVHTTDQGGVFTYQWIKDDGLSGPQPIAAQDQSVEKGQTRAEVHLQWSISGKGTLNGKATATLKIISPETRNAVTTGKVSYSCK